MRKTAVFCLKYRAEWLLRLRDSSVFVSAFKSLRAKYPPYFCSITMASHSHRLYWMEGAVQNEPYQSTHKHTNTFAQFPCKTRDKKNEIKPKISGPNLANLFPTLEQISHSHRPNPSDEFNAQSAYIRTRAPRNSCGRIAVAATKLNRFSVRAALVLEDASNTPYTKCIYRHK